ncbi:gephyrin-like molybdotransferase Glp [Glaciecola siphonariae]|uniref:Molybdopterin molybdenumtransferase n=1 Tax=Glaciecola siphonariae TaxID=521012 RepID=A0ABV9LXE8_9ALTE
MMASCEQPGLMPIDEAKLRISALVKGLEHTESLQLVDALGRVLAQDLHSPINVPGFDNSAMDGYAFNWQDAVDMPFLTLVGKSFAGNPYLKALNKGECVRIMTGAALPKGADTVVMQENAALNGDELSFSKVPPKGNNIRLAGESIRQASLVIAKGKKLCAADIGLLSSLGCDEVSVYRKLKVAVFSTGDELLRTGEPYEPHKIYDGNRPAIIALLHKMQFEVIDLGIVPDKPQALREVFMQADALADCVISTGGVSVGEADFVKDILAERGQIDFWKLAIKPGKPLAFGRLPNSVFFGLPGNPVSAFVTFNQIAADALKQMSGEHVISVPTVSAICTEPLRKQPGRVDFQRGQWSVSDAGELQVSSTGAQGSGIFSSFINSNCYIVLERDRGSVKAGESVQIKLFDDSLT